jgi:hypothetical protein
MLAGVTGAMRLEVIRKAKTAAEVGAAFSASAYIGEED